LESVLVEKQNVGTERLDFVVHPENRLRSRHRPKHTPAALVTHHSGDATDPTLHSSAVSQSDGGESMTCSALE
jgi:hypothetical protein